MLWIFFSSLFFFSVSLSFFQCGRDDEVVSEEGWKWCVLLFCKLFYFWIPRVELTYCHHYTCMTWSRWAWQFPISNVILSATTQYKPKPQWSVISITRWFLREFGKSKHEQEFFYRVLFSAYNLKLELCDTILVKLE